MKNKITLLVLLTSILVFGQQKQPKVGLVLSGGGAKGFAHIGILKELDRAGVQIDYIGGTSMGAIVGALYASGYSGVQIERIVRENDFIYLLRDKIPRNTATFFEKEYGEKTKISFPVTKNGVGLPKGVSKGQSVLNLLNELLGCKDEFTDFSKLPIPFFCVATDVETGGAVTLENGSLPLALRSSGSFPTLLNPVTYGDKLLVDGGIANNFPITKMKEKGMDLIIGVDVEGRLFEKEKLTSVLAILNQIVSYQMYSKTELEKEKLDIYIHPKIFEHTVVDFKSKNQILEKGEKEALKFRKVFEEIAAKQTIKRKRKPIDFDYSKKLISKINIEGSTNNTRAFVLGKLRLKVGDSLTRKEITSSINLLSATKNYDRIEYKLEKLEDDTHQLNFILTETKDNAYISIGAHYDFLYKSGILANYQQKHMLVNNDLFSLDVILGDNLRYNLNYFVDNGFYISYGFRSRYNHFRDNSKFNLGSFQFPNLSSINLNYTDFTNQFFVQTTFNRKFAVGLGIEHKLINATTETIITNGDRTVIDRSNYYSTYGYIKLDTYDKKYFVTKGFFADLNFKWYLFSSDFNNDFRKFAQAKGTLGFATTIWDKLTLQLTNEAGFTLNNPSSTIFDYYLGGYNQNYINNFVSLYGYAFSELSDHSFVKSEFNFRYKMSSKHYAVFIANYARINDNVFKDIDLFQDVISGYAVGYSYDSFLGPIEFKYSWTPDNKESHFLFNLGFWF